MSPTVACSAAQIVGDHRAEVAKRIDVYVTALFHGMSIDGPSDLDLSCTSPLGSPWDAVQAAAQTWSTKAAVASEAIRSAWRPSRPGRKG